MQRLRDLETEHSKLKRVYAELAMENHALKDVIVKKAVDPTHKRPLLAWLVEQHGWSERRACSVVGLARSTARYRCRPDRDEEVIALLSELAERFPSLVLESSFRSSAVVDMYGITKGSGVCALAIEVDLNLPAARVIRTLERSAAWRGYPNKLRLDNGPEFVALDLTEWAERFHRTLQRQLQARRAGHAYIPRAERGPRTDRTLACRLQPTDPTRQPGRTNAR